MRVLGEKCNKFTFKLKVIGFKSPSGSCITHIKEGQAMCRPKATCTPPEGTPLAPLPLPLHSTDWSLRSYLGARLVGRCGPAAE